MITSIKAYTIKCDECGKSHPTYLFRTKGDALVVAEKMPDWHFYKGRTYCPLCWSHACDNISEGEEWRNIDGFSKYQVSNIGRIRNKSTKMILAARENNHTGYLRISLYDNDNKPHLLYIHRIVASAFCEKKDGCNFVDHIDTDRQNNISSNLRWVSRSENCRNQYTILKNSGARIGKKFKRRNRKKVEQYDLYGNFIREWNNYDDAIESVNGSYKGMSLALRGKRKTYKGFVWKYKDGYVSM
jgi:hypothetical protein